MGMRDVNCVGFGVWVSGLRLEGLERLETRVERLGSREFGI